MSRQTIVKKPYCKICHDAGKSESEYNSHWVKDLNGKTTCPVLLNTECRYCFKLGHTAKFCDLLTKKNKKMEQKIEAKKPAIKEEKNTQKSYTTGTNVFSSLYNDDSDIEEEVSNIITEYPSLGKQMESDEKMPREAKTCWAAIAAKPKEDKPVIVAREMKKGLVLLSELVSEEIVKKEQPKVVPIPKKSWADWSDSEEEEEDDLPEVNFNQDEDDTW